MRLFPAATLSSSFLLVPLCALAICWGLPGVLFAISNSLRQPVSMRSEADLVRSAVYREFRTTELEIPPMRGQGYIGRAVIGALSIPLSPSWTKIEVKVARRRRIQEITLKKKIQGAEGSGVSDVVIHCYTLQRFEQPPPPSSSDVCRWVSPFYGSPGEFLRAYPTTLSLFLAVANARPERLHLLWGRPRWRLDALLNLRLTLLPAEEVGVLRTPRLESLILYSQTSTSLPDPGTVSRTTGPEHAARGFVFGAVLFNRAGNWKLTSMRFNVHAASRAQALAAVTRLISASTLVPWVSKPTIAWEGKHQ